MSGWFFGDDYHGPHTEQELAEFAAAGVITGDTVIYHAEHAPRGIRADSSPTLWQIATPQQPDDTPLLESLTPDPLMPIELVPTQPVVPLAVPIAPLAATPSSAVNAHRKQSTLEALADYLVHNQQRLIVILSSVALCLVLIFVVAVLAGRPKTREQIVASAESSVAHIRGMSFSGTGFMVSSSLLVTNKHVIVSEKDSDLRITFPSDATSKVEYHAHVIYEHPEADLAILQLDGSRSPLQLARSHKFRPGQDVIVIGNPGVAGVLTLQNAVSSGILSTTAIIDGNECYQLNIAINSGNSGGPALDDNGDVIGVVTRKATEEEGIGFCVPLATLRESISTAKRLTRLQMADNSGQHNQRVATERLTREAIDLINHADGDDWENASDELKMFACFIYSSKNTAGLDQAAHFEMARRYRNTLDDLYKQVGTKDKVIELLALTLVLDGQEWIKELRGQQ